VFGGAGLAGLIGRGPRGGWNAARCVITHLLMPLRRTSSAPVLGKCAWWCSSMTCGVGGEPGGLGDMLQHNAISTENVERVAQLHDY
jgi:hypothetical protein